MKAETDADFDAWVARVGMVRAQLIHTKMGAAIDRARGGPATPPVDRMTGPQGRRLFALLADIYGRHQQRDDRLRILTDMVGRPITTTNELTRRDAGHVIDVLQREVDRLRAAGAEAPF